MATTEAILHLLGIARQVGIDAADGEWDADPGRPIAPGGESWTGFVNRVADTLDPVAARHPGELVVVACHAGVVEASLTSHLGHGAWPCAAGRRARRHS